MGIRVDAKTGLPKSLAKAFREQSDKAKLEEQLTLGLALKDELNTTIGMQFADNLTNLIMTRANTLISSDPYCQGLIELCRSLDIKINAAEKAAKILTSKLKED